MKILKNGEYYGQIKTEFRTNVYILSQYSYHITRTDWHYHEDPYFMYVLDGNVYDVNQKRETKCNPGTLLFHNWQEKHYNSKHSKNAMGFHIELKRDYLTQLFKHGNLIEGSGLIENPETHIILSKLYKEFLVQDSFSIIGIDSLIIQLLDSLKKSKSIIDKAPIWLQKLTDIIYEDEEIASLKELSGILGLHPVHISRTFSKYYNCTLSEYARMIKIKKSIPLILANKQSIVDIAYHCGFADHSHFTRTFKHYFGLVPSKYKAKHIH